MITGLSSRALTTWVGATLWYDLAEICPRAADGSWSGEWTAPSPFPAAVPRAEALAVLAASPLGGPWIERVLRSSGLPVPNWSLWRRGPKVLVEVARRLTSVFREHGVHSAVGGSLAMFLQHPFRLSADVDFALAQPLSVDLVDRLPRALALAGMTVKTTKRSYIGGSFVIDDLAVSVDIEAGNAYEQPLPHAWDERLTEVAGLACLHRTDIERLKRSYARPKDLADLDFLSVS